MAKDLKEILGKLKYTDDAKVIQQITAQTKQVQDCGMQVVNVYALLDGVHAKFVGRAMHDSPFDSATGQEHGKPRMVMVTAWFGLSFGIDL